MTHDQSEALALSDIVIVMNKGRIEQIDRPERIYDHPRSSFVADFIGSANLIPVTQASPVGDAMVAQTAVGPVRCDRPTPGQAAQRQTGGFVCVRPENVQVRPGDSVTKHPLGGGEFLARIESAEFLGDRIELVITTTDTTLKVATRADLGSRPGDDVTVRLDPSTTSYLAR